MDNGSVVDCEYSGRAVEDAAAESAASIAAGAAGAADSVIIDDHDIHERACRSKIVGDAPAQAAAGQATQESARSGSAAVAAVGQVGNDIYIGEGHHRVGHVDCAATATGAVAAIAPISTLAS